MVRLVSYGVRECRQTGRQAGSNRPRETEGNKKRRKEGRKTWINTIRTIAKQALVWVVPIHWWLNALHCFSTARCRSLLPGLATAPAAPPSPSTGGWEGSSTTVSEDAYLYCNNK
jgi:hypothetical protein